MLGLWNQSAQLNRRCREVHFPRYLGSIDDLTEFEAILATLSEMMPLPAGSSLRRWNQQLYQGSFGCIGMLTEWLERALTEMIVREDAILRLSHIQATAYSAAQLSLIRREIEEGERMLERREQSTERPIVVERKPGRKRKPGIRNPSRDPVGRATKRNPK